VISTRRFPPRLTLAFALRVAPVGAAWAFVVFLLYAYGDLRFLRIPFLPIATIGTAVAFYIGFKNNSAYERFWEGRKIWGGIVNESRSWATSVMSYIGPGHDDAQWKELRRELIYRQLAWINALRLQLRKTSRFFNRPAPSTKRRLERHADVMRNEWDTELAPFLDDEELAQTKSEANAAAQLLRRQAAELAQLLGEKKLDLFHQIAMMEVIRELYALQGKCERIKNTPFPRQYAEYSRIFTRAFVISVPFGLLDVFGDHVDAALSTLETLAPVVPMILAAAAIHWVFVTMESIGDSSEDPFERSMNDVPMNALCRTIEIDLREMLGETDLPAKEKPADGVLY
jgi:putative membrane protein